MRTSQPADQSVTGARSGGQVPAFAALSRYRARATLHEYSHPSAYRAFPQAAQRRLRLRGNICAPTVATAQPMRASNHIPVAKICARIENINEVWFYNTKGDLTTFTNALLHTWSYAYNAAGLVTQSTDPLGNLVTYQYDSLNRLINQIDPLGTQTWAYDSASNLITYTNQNAKISTYAYNTLGLLTRATDPLGNIISYQYATNGWLAQMTQVSHTFTYTYNAIGQRTQDAGPFGTTSYAYNGAGLLT